MQIVLFGSTGGFSAAVLEGLVDSGLTVSGVVSAKKLPGNSDLPVIVKHEAQLTSLESVANSCGVPILGFTSLDTTGFRESLLDVRADLLLVACFDLKIPEAIFGGMGVPCWNLHPSLLPSYRGPSPLYWQIEHGETETGLTLHEVTDELDAGDIVAQRRIPLPETRDKVSLDRWVAEHGVTLFTDALERLQAGELVTMRQDESLASYYPWPSINRDA